MSNVKPEQPETPTVALGRTPEERVRDELVAAIASITWPISGEPVYDARQIRTDTHDIGRGRSATAEFGIYGRADAVAYVRAPDRIDIRAIPAADAGAGDADRITGVYTGVLTAVHALDPRNW